MKRVLSGIQPSGRPHLGNFAGAIDQFVALQEDHELFIFVASYHALTTLRDPDLLRAQTREVVTAYLAAGLNPDRCHLYLQQDVPQVTELAWLLGCVCPVSMMDKAVSYKDKLAKGLTANVGLYTYPVLQAADILAVDPDVVPVGRDQKQHVEITRDLAGRFNSAFGEVFKLPELQLRRGAEILPGVDGQKMSKSYGNDIDPFLPEKQLRKRVMKIVSDSKTVEDPKDPEADATFQIFRGVAGSDDPRVEQLAERYRAGGMGYGEAKQALYELILDRYGDARQRKAQLDADPTQVDRALASGAEAAREVIGQVTQRARQAVGL
jgi:tryptophanyl-tRNA synthetase